MTALQYSHPVRKESPLYSCECGVCVCMSLTKMLIPLSPHSRMFEVGASQDQVYSETPL